MRRMRMLSRGAWALLLGPAPSLACQDQPPPAAAEPEEITGSSSEDGSSDAAVVDVPPGCGNGIVEGDEECDLGFANADDGACTSTCGLPRCGDGLVAAGEACDEGEANGGPTCSAACTRPTRLRWSTTVGASTHGYDLAVAMAPVAAGAVVVALYVDADPPQAVIERWDADGGRAWSTAIVSEPLQHYPLTSTLVPAADGGVLVSIFADVADVEGSERVVLRQLDAAGRPSWSHEVVADALGRPIDGRLTRAGDSLVLAVPFERFDGGLETHVTRLDEAGHVLHERVVEANLRAIAGAPDGGVFGYGGNHLLAYDADDVLRWSVPAPAQGTPALAVDGEGRPLLALRDPGDARHLTAFTADGRPRWDAPLELDPWALAVGPDGTLAVTGRADAEPTELPTNRDLGLEALDAEGQPRWLERVDGPAHDEDAGGAVVFTADGALWVGGDVSVPFEERDAWIGRFEEDPR